MEVIVIDSIEISGFKSFRKKKISLANLTLLTGLNNSGKSSVIQSLRMYSAALSGKSPLLPGHGSVADIRSNFVSPSEQIVFRLCFKDSEIDQMILSNSVVERPSKGPEFFYVGADRLGPQSFLPLSLELDSTPKVGDRGEYVFDFIGRLNETGYLIPDALVHEQAQGSAFEYVLRAWLSEISPGVDFSVELHREADISHAEIDSFRPANVGFGLSYTLPIIAATLGAVADLPTLEAQSEWVENWESRKRNNGVLLILENPEAHLHPQGQTAMGRMIALAAASGVQVIVETHSEHVMDGIRLAVKEKAISNELVKFLYFTKDANGETSIEAPQLSKEGKIDFWPQGFFDQTLKNRAELAKRTR